MYARYRGSGQVEHLIVKPLTFMNRSGIILPELRRFSPSLAEQLIIVCDNMDLPPGQIRIRTGGSSAGHNGIKSIMEYTSDPGFIRVYVGVGRPDQGVSVVDHVLSRPGESETPSFDAGIERAVDALRSILDGVELSKVMNEYNRRKSSEPRIS